MTATARQSMTWFWILAALGFVIDQVSKFAIFAWLQLGEHVTLIDNFLHITHNRLNHGALFGMGGEFGPAASLGFAAFSVVAIVVIIIWTRRSSVAQDRWLMTALGLIVAGAAGNLVDRLLYQGVRDFIWIFHEFTWIAPESRPRPFNYAVFNFADTWLVIGAIMLLLHTFWVKEPARTTGPAPMAPAQE
ncbi:MAG TPA: signal peptidase II [Gemmatales bacterium]|nr:signal peptidase II [Gemmatales bacterium]